MTAGSHWKQAMSEIPDDKSSSLSIRDVIKTSVVYKR